ncbi:MAG: ArnT family glycosyltransferase, partial [Methylocella sp.]
MLPLAGFIAAFALAQLAGRDSRYTLLLAAILWGVFLTLLTEVLSYFYLLTSTNLAVGWAVFGLACLWLTWLLRAKREPRQLAPPLEDSEKVLLCGLGLLIGIVGLTALLAPPNTWDPMEYHLTRVVLWASNRSVQIFPTPDYSQVVFQPWAEFAMLHLYLLWGGDRLVNLVEFASLVGTTVAVSSIAATFGASRFIQIMAAIIAATIPEGILEASGAMNTYVGTFWMTTAAYFVLRWNVQPSWLDLLGFSAAVGLAALTKGTAYVFLPFVLLGCWWIGTPAARRLLVLRLPVAALVPLSINVPQYLRSYRLTGSPLGLPFPDGGPRLHFTSEHISFTGTIANIIRNISLHLGTPIESFNQATFSVVTSLIRWIGEDPNDPGAMFQGDDFHLNHLSRIETLAGNPWHLALIVVSLGLLVLYKKQPAGLLKYALGVIAAFLLYSGLLRWQSMASRHQLVVFVLMAPVVAIAFGNSFSRRAMVALGIALLACSSPFALANHMRSLIPGLN